MKKNFIIAISVIALCQNVYAASIESTPLSNPPSRPVPSIPLSNPPSRPVPSTPLSNPPSRPVPSIPLSESNPSRPVVESNTSTSNKPVRSTGEKVKDYLLLAGKALLSSTEESSEESSSSQPKKVVLAVPEVPFVMTDTMKKELHSIVSKDMSPIFIALSQSNKTFLIDSLKSKLNIFKKTFEKDLKPYVNQSIAAPIADVLFDAVKNSIKKTPYDPIFLREAVNEACNKVFSGKK